MKRRSHPYDPHISNGLFARLLIISLKHSIPMLGKLFRGYLNCDIYHRLPETIFFPHPYGIIITPGTIFGEDVVIGQQVTIGNRNGVFAAPRIGNRVYIAAGAKVLGDITIGDDVIIGANAVVTKDVAADVIVVGANRIMAKKSDYWSAKGRSI
jgi:serine acetyltransferase